MRIRQARSTDADQISKLIWGLCDPFFISPDRVGAEGFLASISPTAIASILDSPSFLYLIAEQGSHVAGVIALRSNTHLFHLFVSKSHQGQGISRTMWQVARTHAIANGNIGRFTVNASINAIPIYQRFGFHSNGNPTESHGIRYQPMMLDEAVIPNIQTPIAT